MNWEPWFVRKGAAQAVLQVEGMRNFCGDIFPYCPWLFHKIKIYFIAFILIPISLYF